MKNNLVATAILAAACALAPPAAASPVTHTYVGTITSAAGPHADAFPVGATVHLSYTLDTSAPDADPLPNQGLYWGALQVLTLEVPDSNFGLLILEGIVQDFNDSGGSGYPHDAFFLSSDLQLEADPIQGVPLMGAGLEFYDFEEEGSVPDMLSNEALPTDPLQPDIAYLVFAASGDMIFTRFGIALHPSATSVHELVAEAELRISSLVDENVLDAGVGRSLVAKLEAVLAASTAGRNGACGPLLGLGNQIEALSRRNPAVANELDPVLTALDAELGC